MCIRDRWIPGAGRPDESHWPAVYRKFHAAGKLIQLFDLHSLDAVSRQIGTSKGIALLVPWLPYSRMGEAEEVLKRYGVE